MSDFQTHDQLIYAASQLGQIYVEDRWKQTAAGSAGLNFSYWPNVGQPGVGANPAAGSGTLDLGGTARTNAVGSINFPDQSPAVKRFVYFGALSPQKDTIVSAADRLVDVSAVSLNGVGLKSVNSVPLTRYTSGVDVECWIEYTTASTTTASVFRINYTNSSGVNGRTSASVTAPLAAMPVKSMLRVWPLQAGDVGIRSVQTLEVLTSTTSAVVNLILLKRLAQLESMASVWCDKDLIQQPGGPPQIFDGASIFFWAFNMNPSSQGQPTHFRMVVPYL